MREEEKKGRRERGKGEEDPIWDMNPMAVFMTYNSCQYHSLQSLMLKSIQANTCTLCGRKGEREDRKRGEGSGGTCLVLWQHMHIHVHLELQCNHFNMFQLPPTHSNQTPPSQVRNSSVTMTVSFSPTLEELKTSGNRKLSSAQSS